MKYDDDQIAEAIHTFNRLIQRWFGEQVSAEWPYVPDAMRHRLMLLVRGYRNGMTPRQAHERWCELMRADGWVWGTVKDPAGNPPTHPNLVDYGELPQCQKDKDVFSHQITVMMIAQSTP